MEFSIPWLGGYLAVGPGTALLAGPRTHGTIDPACYDTVRNHWGSSLREKSPSTLSFADLKLAKECKGAAPKASAGHAALGAIRAGKRPQGLHAWPTD